jgi:hypothetical protein
MAIKPLNRRAFLRGIGGTAIALPALDIMLNSHGDAFAGNGADIPCRFFVGFNGQSMGADNDPLDNLYVPDNVGPNYDLKTATMPLGDHGNVRDRITIVSDLRIPYNDGNGIPAGGWDTDFHIQALGPLISGMRKDGPAGDFGVTADQVVAAAVGGQTTFDSLQYQAQASWYLTESAPYGRDILSYRDAGNGTESLPGQISPQAAFNSLFTGFVPPDPGDAAAAAYELAKRKSVLDLVRGDIDLLMPKLGAVDKIRMQRHLDEIRDLEMVLDSVPPDVGPSCMMLPDPGADPAVGGNNVDASGDGFDINKGYSDEDARARVFTDLIHMAYVCDLTRSVSLLYTMAQSHMSVHPLSGFAYDQHELGHSSEGTAAMAVMQAWHVDQFARLVAKLRDTPEGAGSLLDNCALVLLHEGGHGWDPGALVDNSSHSTENMACMIAGGAGGLTQGEHVVASGLHPVNVLITAMHAVGVEQDLGEVSGTVPGLLP